LQVEPNNLRQLVYIITFGAVTVVLALHYTRQCTGRAGFNFEKHGRNDCRTRLHE
jgi:hypothetical protein